MTKKFVLLILIFPAVYCQQLFTSNEYGFEMTFPAYMNVYKGSAENVAVIASVNDNTSLNVVLSKADETAGRSMDDYPLDSFVNSLESSLKNYVSDFQKIDYGREVINGNSSIYLTYEYLKDAKYIRAKQYFIVKDSTMFAITAMCLESEAADYEIVFNQCVNSFKFIE